MNVFQIEGTISLIIFFVLLAVKLFALVSALTFSGASYEAAGKLTKVAWCAILGLGLATHLLLPTPILSIAFAVAAFVYLADVRPALSNLTRR